MCPVPSGSRPISPPHRHWELAADESVILAWWQLRDGVADHGFWKGAGYRAASRVLLDAYRRAAELRPDFDRHVRDCLDELSALEAERCPSMDRAADTFARILQSAAATVDDPVRRRVLEQMFYHLGRWIYLVDAADDLREMPPPAATPPVAPALWADGRKMDGGEPAGLCKDTGPVGPYDRHGL